MLVCCCRVSLACVVRWCVFCVELVFVVRCCLLVSLMTVCCCLCVRCLFFVVWWLRFVVCWLCLVVFVGCSLLRAHCCCLCHDVSGLLVLFARCGMLSDIC